jgi:hypothetical protein
MSRAASTRIADAKQVSRRGMPTLAMRTRLPLFALVACSKPAMEITPAAPPACSMIGWEHVEFSIKPQRAGQLDVEVVDRLGVSAPVERLMGPDDVRYFLTSIGREDVRAGDELPLQWSFGSEQPSAKPAPNACRDQEDEHGLLQSAWTDPKMCTREAGRLGRSGSSSSLFEPSCSHDLGYRPTRLVRSGTIFAAEGEWVWLAAWVWAPPETKVALHSSGATWSFTVDGAPAAIDGPYPAWTLRARLVQQR